ncbi:MAG: RDD family protein [Halobacteriales archaeon]|nr:RDD family protein [Halobacteriales archaeon]
MQMTTEARGWLDATVRRILARHVLGDPERSGITYELMSHLHAVAEERAAAAGRTEVTREDLEAAHAKAGGDDGLAAAFVQPLAKPLVRAPLLPRAGAFLIDALLIGIGLVFIHMTLQALLLPLFGGGGVAYDAGHTFPRDATHGWFAFLPWGYHDPTMGLVGQGIIALASSAFVLGYFTWTEGSEGRSLGKRALELRVVRVDGKPMTYREGFIRNLVKVSPIFLALDALLMLVASPERRQRMSDRVAETIVVRG